MGLPCRILNIDHEKELLRGLWLGFRGPVAFSSKSARAWYQAATAAHAESVEEALGRLPGAWLQSCRAPCGVLTFGFRVLGFWGLGVKGFRA